MYWKFREVVKGSDERTPSLFLSFSLETLRMTHNHCYNSLSPQTVCYGGQLYVLEAHCVPDFVEGSSAIRTSAGLIHVRVYSHSVNSLIVAIIVSLSDLYEE